MIRLVLRNVGAGRLAKPRVLVCVPSLLTPVERRAVEEAVVAAGAKSAALIDEPLAAAVGAGLPIHEPLGNLVVDVGGGTSEIAVLAMGGIVLGKSIPIGGFDRDGAMLRGLDMRVAQECEVPVHLTELPLATVALGAGHLLDSLPDYGPFLAGQRSG